MKMTPLPMSITEWDEIAPTRHPGESGFALWRTRTFNDIRVRRVEYSPGYRANQRRAKAITSAMAIRRIEAILWLGPNFSSWTRRVRGLLMIENRLVLLY